MLNVTGSVVFDGAGFVLWGALAVGLECRARGGGGWVARRARAGVAVPEVVVAWVPEAVVPAGVGCPWLLADWNQNHGRHMFM